MSNERIYLDYNATTPLAPEVATFARENLEKFGNPSSVHWAGREAKRVISDARESISKFINCGALEIVFTAGGSEANNLALNGFLQEIKSERNEIICSRVEHPSVIKTVEDLVKHDGFVVRWLDVSRDGLIDLEQLKKLLNPRRTALVSVQLVNNETGNIFPLKEISKLAHEAGALVHSDMVQALGKISIDLKDLGVDLASFAGHKFYSLKGAGFLFVKRGIHLEPLIHGGGQERGRRAGTENALAIGSLGESIRLLGPRMREENERLLLLCRELEQKILSRIPQATIVGAKGPRTSNTVNVNFEDVDGETLLINLDTRGFAVSSGAACSSGSQEPSPVLRAMGLSSLEASQNMRVSLGWLTTKTEVDQFFDCLLQEVEKMRTALADGAYDDAEIEGLETIKPLEVLPTKNVNHG